MNIKEYVELSNKIKGENKEKVGCEIRVYEGKCTFRVSNGNMMSKYVCRYEGVEGIELGVEIPLELLVKVVKTVKSEKVDLELEVKEGYLIFKDESGYEWEKVKLEGYKGLKENESKCKEVELACVLLDNKELLRSIKGVKGFEADEKGLYQGLSRVLIEEEGENVYVITTDSYRASMSKVKKKEGSLGEGYLFVNKVLMGMLTEILKKKGEVKLKKIGREGKIYLRVEQDGVEIDSVSYEDKCLRVSMLEGLKERSERSIELDVLKLKRDVSKAMLGFVSKEDMVKSPLVLEIEGEEIIVGHQESGGYKDLIVRVNGKYLESILKKLKGGVRLWYTDGVSALVFESGEDIKALMPVRRVK